MRRALLGQGRTHALGTSRHVKPSPVADALACRGSDGCVDVAGRFDEGERGSGVLARTAHGQGCNHEQQEEHGAGDQQTNSPAFLLDHLLCGVEFYRRGATLGGVMGESLVGIDADGLGDGSDEAAGVDLAGEVIVAAFFEALELGEGDAGCAGESIDGQSALDSGPP